MIASLNHFLIFNTLSWAWTKIFLTQCLISEWCIIIDFHRHLRRFFTVLMRYAQKIMHLPALNFNLIHLIEPMQANLRVNWFDGTLYGTVYGLLDWEIIFHVQRDLRSSDFNRNIFRLRRKVAAFMCALLVLILFSLVENLCCVLVRVWLSNHLVLNLLKFLIYVMRFV